MYKEIVFLRKGLELVCGAGVADVSFCVSAVCVCVCVCGVSALCVWCVVSAVCVCRVFVVCVELTTRTHISRGTEEHSLFSSQLQHTSHVDRMGEKLVGLSLIICVVVVCSGCGCVRETSTNNQKSCADQE